MKATSTQEKYYNFLKSLSQRQRGFASVNKVVSKAGLCSLIGSIIKNDGLIKKSGSVYKWAGASPTTEMADKLLNKVNTRLLKYSKPGKQSDRTSTPSQPKHQYTKRVQPTKSSDIIDLSKLRQERIEMMNRVQKIDAMLEVASTM